MSQDHLHLFLETFAAEKIKPFESGEHIWLAREGAAKALKEGPLCSRIPG